MKLLKLARPPDAQRTLEKYLLTPERIYYMIVRMPHQVWTDAKREEIRNILKTLDLLREQVEFLARKPGRPRGNAQRVPSKPFVLAEVSEWLKGLESETWRNLAVSSWKDGTTKRSVMIVLCHRGPWRSVNELSTFLHVELGIQNDVRAVHRILTELINEGLVVRGQLGYENYWHNHTENVIEDGVWAKPVQWAKRS